MKKTWRLMFVGVVVCLTLGILSVSAFAEKVTIRVALWSGVVDIPTVQKIVAEFERTHPDIRVEFDSTIPFIDYFIKISAMMGSGTAPDVVATSLGNFPGWARAGQIRNLSEFIKQDSSFKPERLFDRPYEAYQMAGGQWGIPFSFTCVAMYYNQDLFHEAGLPNLPTDWNTKGWTWDDVLNYAKKLTKRQGNRITQYGIWATVADLAELQTWARLNNAYVIKPNLAIDDETLKKAKVVVDSPEMLETVTFIRDLIYKYRVAPSAAEMGEQNTTQLFSTGRVAMYAGGSGGLNAYIPIKSFKWDIGVLPMKKRRVTANYANALLMTSSTKHPNEAWEFIKFFVTSAESAVPRAKARNEIPSLKEVAYSDHFLKPAPPEHINVFLKGIEFDAETVAIIPRFQEVRAFIKEGLEPVMVNSRTPQEALKIVKARLETLIPNP